MYIFCEKNLKCSRILLHITVISSVKLVFVYSSKRKQFITYYISHWKQKDLLYTTEFKKELGNNDTEEISILKQLLDNRDDVSLHNKLIRAEMKYWLPNYHLIKEDKIAYLLLVANKLGEINLSLDKKRAKIGNWNNIPVENTISITKET